MNTERTPAEVKLLEQIEDVLGFPLIGDQADRLLALARECYQPKTNWEDCAREYARNCEYYRGLVVKCGELLGPAAKTQDDGGIVPDVLCAKVPELVAALGKDRDLWKEGCLRNADLYHEGCRVCDERRLEIVKLKEALTFAEGKFIDLNIERDRQKGRIYRLEREIAELRELLERYDIRMPTEPHP